ncbi:MAG: efflux RND transporter periplasmic adaptor subunit [Pseudomonadota bacterium]|nr:efflux RND transporter periplasmic adaptor subunit [Pseudomonadota bacterium]MDP1905751.1 efflux RND transporter periplasmic adaptor subunit [Pseudomonadota bacterium]MDP2353376.1 efflux RND transporter periplasmic adaptor subunit [Pseudomonadota bacterium]
MRFTPFLFSAVCLLTLAACGDKTTDNPTEVATTATAEAAHGHGGDGEKITHFTDRTELFVEFPRLVVGEKSAFAAHLSQLSDFKAVTAGKVTVRLGGGGQTEETFTVAGPSQPGIFRPEAMPKHAGKRQLSIEVSTPEFSVTHALGPVTVYPDHKAAVAAPSAHEDEGIGFTKEQQWKVDFATAEVVTRPIRGAINATGTLRARPDGEALLTAQAAGQVRPAGAFPRLGQTVNKGQLLAYLAPRLGGDADLATLRTAARKAQLELDLAGLELGRAEDLYRESIMPEKRVQVARAAAASARAELDAARQRLGQYGGGTGGIPLRAPISGTIADVRVSPGAYAQEGALLFHIADRRGMWLELRVPESEAARLSNPSGAVFRVTGDERGFEIIPGKNGRLVAVGGVVDATSRTLPVVFEFTPPAGQLFPIGMAVQAQVFVGAARDAVAIPASSVLDEGGMAVVFVQAGGESFERRTVRLGTREGDWVEVLDGLAPGLRVVSRGAYLVKLASTGTAQIGHGHAH